MLYELVASSGSAGHRILERGERLTPFRTFAPHIGGYRSPDPGGSAYGLPPRPPRKPPDAEPALVTTLVIVKPATCVPPV